jgi:hypothetical protein
MKPLGLIAAAAVALAVGLYLAWGWVFPSGTLRYRLTVDVEADGKVHTGSGVIEVTFRRHGWSDTQTLGVHPTLKGEAIPVDLGERGTFFVLLQKAPDRGAVSDPAYLPLQAFDLESGGLTGDKLRRLGSVSARATVKDLPLMVRFRDLKEPMSVERVDPGNLEKSFGSGVRLIRATVETTRDPLTTGILKRLPWLPEYHSKLFDGRRIHTIEAPNQLANSLGSGSFKTPKD